MEPNNNNNNNKGFKSNFHKIAEELSDLVVEKNKAYGNSFDKSGDFMKLLYPNGVKPEQYDDMLTAIRLFDKLMRVANKKNAFGESPWRDALGYSLLAVNRDEEKSHNEQTEKLEDNNLNKE